MSTVLLIRERNDVLCVVARRVHMRDRVAARVRVCALDAALARGVAPESSPALALRAQALIGPAMRQQLGDHVHQIALELPLRF